MGQVKDRQGTGRGLNRMGRDGMGRDRELDNILHNLVVQCTSAFKVGSEDGG